MRCERQGLCLVFIVIGLCLLPVWSSRAYGEEKVSMPVRPFAVNPENKFMRFDGIFNTGTDKDVETIEHIIGVFLKNESGKPIFNVKATASFDSDSGVEIVPGYDTYEYKVLEPGIPELGFFRAKFAKNSFGKPTLKVKLNGDNSFEYEVGRRLFVINSTLDSEKDNCYTVYAPEGKITVEISKFYGGVDEKSATAPKEITFIVEHMKAFEEKLSGLPYSDPWWTTIAGIVPEGEYLNAIDKETAKLYGAEGGITPKNIGRAIFSAGIISLISSKGDPFRIGQENTSPGPDEVTAKEKVNVSLDYPKEPSVEELYTAKAHWKYERIMTDAKVHTYESPKDGFKNKLVSGKPIKVNIKTRKSPTGGMEFFITAQTNSTDMSNNKLYLVANLFKSDDWQLKEVVQAIVLRDDGQEGDRKPGDGVYTGIGSVKGLPPNTPLNVNIFGFDVNNAAESDSPFEAAKNIGGVFISAPPPIPFVWNPEKEEKEKKKENESKKEDKKENEKKTREEPQKSQPPKVTKTTSFRPRAGSVLKGGLNSITLDGWGTLELSVTTNHGIPEEKIKAANISGSFSGGLKLSLGHEWIVLGTSHTIGVSLGYRVHLRGTFSLSKEKVISDFELTTSAIPLELFYRISLGKKSNFFIGLSAGLDFYKSKIKDRGSDDFEAYKDSIIGRHASLEIGHFFGRLALTLNAAYSAAKFKDFKKTKFPEEVWEPLEIDFTGFRLSFGFKLRLK